MCTFFVMTVLSLILETYELVIRNKRVLVASQANLAVDNALERLISNPKIRAIRLGNTIVREMISNTLMHREFTSSYTAKFVIEKKRMYVENANRASKEGIITVDNLEPNPKNPIIAAFFRNIGYADQLGSGVRKLFKYSKYYSGRDPQFVEDDVFRIVVPLDDEYSFDYSIIIDKDNENASADKVTSSADKMPISADEVPINTLSEQQKKVLHFAKENGQITSHQVELLLEVKQRRARSILGKLVDM